MFKTIIYEKYNKIKNIRNKNKYFNFWEIQKKNILKYIKNIKNKVFKKLYL